MSLGLGFILKKAISFLLMPLTIGMLLALLGLWFLHKENIKKAQRFLLMGLVWIALVTYAPVTNLLIEPLEKQYSKLEKIPNGVEYILLLGGGRKHRAWEAIRLYHQIPNVKIITSGYSMHDNLSDAQKTAKLLEESGVKREDIIIQSNVKDTKEEAIAIKLKLGEKPFILVTSAYHMPRSIKIFQSEGLNPTPAPADFNNPNEDGFNSIFQSKQLEKTEQALHEYLGLLWFSLRN